jgi:hypothetical protein
MFNFWGAVQILKGFSIDKIFHGYLFGRTSPIDGFEAALRKFDLK